MYVYFPIVIGKYIFRDRINLTIRFVIVSACNSMRPYFSEKYLNTAFDLWRFECISNRDLCLIIKHCASGTVFRRYNCDQSIKQIAKVNLIRLFNVPRLQLYDHSTVRSTARSIQKYNPFLFDEYPNRVSFMKEEWNNCLKHFC